MLTNNVKYLDLAKQFTELSQRISSAQRICNRFGIKIDTFLGGLTYHVENANDCIFKSLTDLIIESEPTAENPVSRQDLEALFTVFDFSQDEKTRLYAACEIDDKRYAQYVSEERRQNDY